MNGVEGVTRVEDDRPDAGRTEGGSGRTLFDSQVDHLQSRESSGAAADRAVLASAWCGLRGHDTVRV